MNSALGASAPVQVIDVPVQPASAEAPQGITLQCRQAGAGRPQRVLLLHGFPEGAFIWDELMQALAPRAHLLAPDQRGYGASSAPTEVKAYRPRQLVGDIVALVERVFGGPADVLVAHDWGGAIAWNLAAQRPDLFKRLVMVNSAHPATFVRELKGNPAQQAASLYMNELAQPGAEAQLAANGFARLWQVFERFGPAAWLTPELRSRYQAHWQRGLQGQLNWYRATPVRPATGPDDALHTLQLPDEAVTVRVPTTLVWGLDDHALLPCLMDGLQRWVPQLRLVPVPGASHWIVHEQPALVRAEIERALDEAAAA
jgi:pimeloyl-ACP methyl ester carboxylesterase